MPSSPPVTASSPGPRKKGPARRIEVANIVPLSPRMVRIGFIGADLGSFEWRGPAGHLKLIVPADGEHEAPMPAPEGPRAPLMRTYTPRRFDAAAQRLDIDFVLHEHGPAGRWAMRAQVGDRLAMMGPAPGYRIDAGAPWFLLIGDDTALPAIESILEELPSGASAQVLMEVHGDDEARSLHSAAAVDVRWLARGPDERSAGARLLSAVQGLAALPSGPGCIYVGCESAAMRRIRQHLIEARQIERSRLVTRGYWQLGEANHPDHDYGDDSGG